MKILLVLAGLLAALAAGALGAALFAPAAHPTATSAVEPSRTAAPSPGLPAATEQRLQSLSMEVADLQAQIRELKSAAARSAVAVAEPAQETAASAPVLVQAAQREVILQVLADAKAEEERQREEQRLKREEEQRLQLADRMAQRFGLNESQERQLADFYAQSQTKLDEARESMRLARESGSLDQEQMRTMMRDTRDWANAELERLFGPETGKEIAEASMDRFRGGGFGGGPGGPGGGGQGGRRGGGGGNGGGGAPGG